MSPPRYPIEAPSVYDRFARGENVPLSLEQQVAALTSAVRVLKPKADRLDQIVSATALAYASVVGVQEKFVLIHNGEKVASVPRPEGLDWTLKRGQVLKITEDGGIVGMESDPPTMGLVVSVSKKHEPGVLEITDGTTTRLVYDASEKADVGHHVVLDFTMTVVVADFGKPPSSLAFTEETGVTWDDVGGLEEAKRELREALEGPVLHAELYREFGASASKGVLLFGAPGNGKTFLCRAAHTALATLTGHKASQSGFIYVKGPEVLNSYLGASEAGVRKIFASGRSHFDEHGYPAIVCIDEADALVGKRTDSKLSIEKTIVPQFLAEMDGLDPSHVFVMLLTNRPDTLDPAIVRPGRIDRKIEIGAPTRKEAEAIVERSLSKRLLSGDAKEMASGALDEVHGRRNDLAMVRVKHGGDRRVGLSDLISGALLVNLVDRATLLAIRRAQKSEGARGITVEDLLAAVRDAPAQIRKTTTDEDLVAAVSKDVGGMDNVKAVDWL